MKNINLINLSKQNGFKFLLTATFMLTNSLVMAANVPTMVSTVAIVENVKGDVKLSQVQEDKSIALIIGMELPEGAKVVTGANGRVKLRFVDDSVMIVSDNTKFVVNKFSLNKGKRAYAEVALEVGLISQKVSPGPNDSWTVKTPSIVTAVRGTEFIVDARPDYSADVIIKSGNVWVNSLKRTRSIPVSLDEPNTAVVCDAKGTCKTDVVEVPKNNLAEINERLSGI